MKKVLMLAAMAGAAMLLPTMAFAQFAQAPAGTTVDLSPVVNPLIQGLGVIITGMLIPLAWKGYRLLEKKLGLEDLKIEQQYRSAIDQGAQTAIGGALSKLKVPDGKLSIDVKNSVIAEAANKLIESFPAAMESLKSDDKVEKAREIIESRLGLMDAAAAGTPVPNPSQATVVVATPSVVAVPVV